jgi:hypothetical protein
MRWSKKVYDGLINIYALASMELENHELSEMDCRCDVCTGKADNWKERGCECDGKPYTKRCEGCRTTEEWETAIRWLGQLLDKKGR